MIPPKQVLHAARCMLHGVDCTLILTTVCRSFDVTMIHRHKFYLSCFTTDPVLTDPLNSEMELYRRSGLAWSHCAVQHPVCRWSVCCEERCSGQAARNARDAACDMHNLKRATHDMRHEQHATQQHNSMRHASQRAAWIMPHTTCNVQAGCAADDR